MATFKELIDSDIKTTRSFLNQLVDVIQTDISSSNTRRSYQVFVTGGVGPGVTSSLFQTVFDQDFSLQTSNPIMDLTVGIFSGSASVASCSTGVDSAGKVLFPSNSLMMREKIANYKQMALQLLGNADSQFYAPFSGYTAETDKVDHMMVMGIKRLFSRDTIKRETFAMKWYKSASHTPVTWGGGIVKNAGWTQYPNLHQTSESGSVIYTDVGSSQNLEVSFGGEVGNIVNSGDTSQTVGLMFYQQGIALFDLKKIISGSQHVSGVISAMNGNAFTTYNANVSKGQTLIGSPPGDPGGGGGSGGTGKSSNSHARFIPDLMTSASIDDIVNHLASCRFSSGSLTALTFQNLTNINSTLLFCRATADEFNYSSNPTYVDSDNRIRVIDVGQEATQKAFSFITTVGLYDANDNLLAVAKLSRPIEKNNEKDITIRVRLDF